MIIKKRVCVKWQQTENVFHVNTNFFIYLSCLTIRTELERIQGEGGGNKKQNQNIFSCSFDFNTSSLCLQFFFSTVHRWICAFYVTVIYNGVKRMKWHRICLKKGTRILASTPVFHSFPPSISCHLFLSCTKPDEGHLTNVLFAMLKSKIWQHSGC